MAISSRVDTIFRLLADDEQKKLVPWLELFYGENKPFIPIFCEALLEGKSEKEAWNAAFPGEKFSKQKYHRRCFMLADAMDEYLYSLQVRRSQNEANRLLLEAYNARGGLELLDRAQARIQSELFARITSKGEQRSLSVESLRLAHELSTVRQVLLASSGPMALKEGISDLNDTFDTWWLHEKLYLTVLTIYYNFSKEIPELPFLADRAIEEAAKLIPADIHDESLSKLSLRFLYHLIMDVQLKPGDLSRDPEVIPALFNWLRRLVYQHNPLPYSLINFFYLLLGNIISRSNRTADLNMRHFYLKQIWEMYMLGIKYKFILQGGSLPYGTFLSLLNTAYRLADYEKGEEGQEKKGFLNNLYHLTSLLPRQDRGDAVLIGEAMLYYYQKEYSRAQRLLNVKFRQPLFEVLGRSFLCQSMYEQYLMRSNADFEELRDYSNSLIRYIDRANGLTESFSERMRNFCLFFDKLCKDYRRDRLPGLEQRIQKTEAVAHREWLILKVRHKLEEKEEKVLQD
ncbi:MAG: hypothetical protein R3B47_00250 [Bacteroidia bacterium]